MGAVRSHVWLLCCRVAVPRPHCGQRLTGLIFAAIAPGEATALDNAQNRSLGLLLVGPCPQTGGRTGPPGRRAVSSDDRVGFALQFGVQRIEQFAPGAANLVYPASVKSPSGYPWHRSGCRRHQALGRLHPGNSGRSTRSAAPQPGHRRADLKSLFVVLGDSTLLVTFPHQLLGRRTSPPARPAHLGLEPLVSPAAA